MSCVASKPDIESELSEIDKSLAKIRAANRDESVQLYAFRENLRSLSDFLHSIPDFSPTDQCALGERLNRVAYRTTLGNH